MKEHLVLCKLLDIKQLEHFSEIVLRRADNDKVVRVHTGKSRKDILVEMQKILNGERENVSIQKCAIGVDMKLNENDIETDKDIKFCYDVNEVDINRLYKTLDSELD